MSELWADLDPETKKDTPEDGGEEGVLWQSFSPFLTNSSFLKRQSQNHILLVALDYFLEDATIPI